MGQIRLSGTVGVPVEQVFEYLTDLANAPPVFRGVKELQPITPGPIHQGSKLLAIRGEFNEEFTVASYDPPSSYTLEGGIPRLATSIRYDLEPKGAGTLISLVFTWRLRGLWRMAAPLFRRRMRNEYRETFAHVIDRIGALAEGHEQPSDR